MITEEMRVGLVVQRRTLTGPWGGVAWTPTTVFATPPDVAAWTPLGRGGGSGGDLATWYAGEQVVALYSTDTANYSDNLASGAPKLWVVLRAREEVGEAGAGVSPPIDVLLVTADPAEGEGNTEAGANIVETVAMPAEIAAAVAAFVEAHHVERAVYKRQRDKTRPALAERSGPRPRPRRDGET